MKKYIFTALILFSFEAYACEAGFDYNPRPELAEITNAAELIIIGKAHNDSVAHNQDDGSYQDILLLSTLKGDVEPESETIRVNLQGHMCLDNDIFVEGERKLIFLKQDDNNIYTPTFISAGSSSFSIIGNSNGAEYMQNGHGGEIQSVESYIKEYKLKPLPKKSEAELENIAEYFKNTESHSHPVYKKTDENGTIFYMDELQPLLWSEEEFNARYVEGSLE